jgi:proteasome lid subunit RPN8/RPN11
MTAQAEGDAPLESCGLLAGLIEGEVGRVVERYPLVNVAASPTLFESEPRSLFDATRDMLRRGLDILAVYHSHPTSAPVPSKTDLQRNYSTDVVNLIVSLVESPPLVRGWWLSETDYREAQWEVIE